MKMKGNVLVVEDDEDWREEINEILEDEGYKVRVAATRSQAQSELDANSFDVAIIDINLTNVTANRDGEEVFNYIMASGLPTKVIILSGTDIPDKDAKYKPFRTLHKTEEQVFDKLLEAVYEIVRSENQ
jgi:DNA-binding NtrC family response regulator